MKYVPSALIGQLSGSQGSTTASRNRAGSYLRNRVMPVNPSSPAQALVRGQLASISAAWRTITAEQRAAWSTLGLSMVRQDSLGQTQTLTGQQAFVSVNRNLLTIGGSMVSNAPAFVQPTQLTALTLTATST